MICIKNARSLSTVRGNSRPDHKFYSKLEQIIGSSSASSLPEITYNVEEVVDDDDDDTQDGEEDLQFIGHSGQLEIGTMLHSYP